jgi:transcriptional regulator with XRE-family HTH domain
VKGLRTKLGASREVFAKLLGVSDGSILNWETPGRVTITLKNLTKLRELAKRANDGDVKLTERKRGGTPKKAVAANLGASERGRPASVAIFGEVPILYANLVTVERGEHDARIRFGLSMPDGGTAWAVVDVVMLHGPLALFARG